MRYGIVKDFHGHPCSGAALLEIQEGSETVLIPCDASQTLRSLGKIGTVNIAFKVDKNGILKTIGVTQ